MKSYGDLMRENNQLHRKNSDLQSKVRRQSSDNARMMQKLERITAESIARRKLLQSAMDERDGLSASLLKAIQEEVAFSIMQDKHEKRLAA